jgi:hypothetical protein
MKGKKGSHFGAGLRVDLKQRIWARGWRYVASGTVPERSIPIKIVVFLSFDFEVASEEGDGVLPDTDADLCGKHRGHVK